MPTIPTNDKDKAIKPNANELNKNIHARQLKELKENELKTIAPDNKEPLKILWQQNGIYKTLHNEIKEILKQSEINKKEISWKLIKELQAVKQALNKDLNGMPNGNYLFKFNSELLEISYNNVELIYLINLLIIRIEKEYYKKQMNYNEHNSFKYELKRISDILEHKEPITKDLF